MRRWRFDSTSLLLLGFALAAGPTIALAPAPVRVIVALLLIGVVPGYSIVRPMRLGDPSQAMPPVIALSAIASSLSITALVSTTLMYATVWSWPLCAVVLAVVTTAGVLVETRRAQP